MVVCLGVLWVVMMVVQWADSMDAMKVVYLAASLVGGLVDSMVALKAD